MSGHSKWSSIKHKKAAKDAKRGKLFSKLIKEITVAARLGGSDINGNPRLRTAVLTAREASMPNDNIERAIKKGTGEVEGANYEEVTYEGYSAGGAAVLVNALTDNRNRTVSEIRRLFEKRGGSMGTAGCVAWMFKKRGVIAVEPGNVDEDRLMEVALDAGAEDVNATAEGFDVLTAPEAFESVKAAIARGGVPMAHAEVALLPDNTTSLTGREAEQTMRLLQELDDHDDVQSVASNADFLQEDIERLSA